MSKAAVSLTNAIRLELSKPEYCIRLWKAGVYQGHIYDARKPGGKGRYVSVGEQGVSDIVGVWGPFGVTLCIEIKAGKDRMRTNQVHFQDMTLGKGAIHIVAHSVEECLRDLEEQQIEWLERITEYVRKTEENYG